MMKENVLEKKSAPAEYSNATLLILEEENSALTIIKESPVIDNPAIYHPDLKERDDLLVYKTGGFKLENEKLLVTGTGIGASDLSEKKYRKSYKPAERISLFGIRRLRKFNFGNFLL